MTEEARRKAYALGHCLRKASATMRRRHLWLQGTAWVHSETLPLAYVGPYYRVYPGGRIEERTAKDQAVDPCPPCAR